MIELLFRRCIRLNSNVVSMWSKAYEEKIDLRHDTVYIPAKHKNAHKRDIAKEYTKAWLRLLSNKVN